MLGGVLSNKDFDLGRTMSYKNKGDEATNWFLRQHFRNHGLTVLRYFLKRGFMETLVKAYNICVTMVAQGHRHQLSIPHSYACNIYGQLVLWAHVWQFWFENSL